MFFNYSLLRQIIIKNDKTLFEKLIEKNVDMKNKGTKEVNVKKNKNLLRKIK